MSGRNVLFACALSGAGVLGLGGCGAHGTARSAADAKRAPLPRVEACAAFDAIVSRRFAAVAPPEAGRAASALRFYRELGGDARAAEVELGEVHPADAELASRARAWVDTARSLAALARDGEALTERGSLADGDFSRREERELDRLRHEVAATADACRGAPAVATPLDARTAGSDWIGGPQKNPRELTAIVRAFPPTTLRAALEAAAANARQDDLATALHATAAGGFGSGFVVVPRGGRAYVITNRHVVDVTERARIDFADGSVSAADVVYTDARYDLAVLAPRDADVRARLSHGFVIAPEPPHDQQTVIAAGYPHLGDQPSYQVAKGYVSNERFPLQTGGEVLAYVQHTAPIDAGSSGGPLLDEVGRLVGVNTFKVSGREAAAFAVPAAAVAEAVARAEAIEGRASSPSRREAARDACLAIVEQLGAAQPRFYVRDRLVSNRLLARDGEATFRDLGATADEATLQSLAQAGAREPLALARWAVWNRLEKRVQASGGVSPRETCAAIDDARDDVRVTLHATSGAPRVMTLRFEEGHARLVALD